MTDEIPLFPKAETLFIDTGNILNWERLKRKAFQPAGVEVTDSSGKVLADWLTSKNKDDLQLMTDLKCINEKCTAKLTPESRETVKITVKLFVCSLLADEIRDVIETVLERLGVKGVDTLLLSIPSARLSLDTLQSFWRQLEVLHGEGKIGTLGTCDLGSDMLGALWDLAEVKPQVNQVNLDSCCVMPPDLKELAAEKSISLTTHSDPADIVPSAALASTLTSVATAADAQDWTTRYIARHVSMVKHRGIIHGRGYLLEARRSSRARPTLE